MAFGVRIEIIFAWLLALVTWRNNRRGLMVESKSRQLITIVTMLSKEDGKTIVSDCQNRLKCLLLSSKAIRSFSAVGRLCADSECTLDQLSAWHSNRAIQFNDRIPLFAFFSMVCDLFVRSTFTECRTDIVFAQYAFEMLSWSLCLIQPHIWVKNKRIDRLGLWTRTESRWQNTNLCSKIEEERNQFGNNC